MISRLRIPLMELPSTTSFPIAIPKESYFLTENSWFKYKKKKRKEKRKRKKRVANWNVGQLLSNPLTTANKWFTIFAGRVRRVVRRVKTTGDSHFRPFCLFTRGQWATRVEEWRSSLMPPLLIINVNRFAYPLIHAGGEIRNSHFQLENYENMGLN